MGPFLIFAKRKKGIKYKDIIDLKAETSIDLEGESSKGAIFPAPSKSKAPPSLYNEKLDAQNIVEKHVELCTCKLISK